MEQNMFIRILNSEMELATGCTEPGAVALTAAEAGQALRKAGVDKAEEITVNASINIIKNAMSAGIPGTDYEGMDYAAAIGALGGDPVYLLEVMNHVPRETVEAAAALVKAGKATVAVRVMDTGGKGGIFGDANSIALAKSDSEKLPLAGQWKYKVSMGLGDAPDMPVNTATEPNYPTFLFNAMINPLVDYAIRGAIWYQGEANVARAAQYRDLLPLMIHDWRQHWGYAFPFYIVQLPNYMKAQEGPEESEWAELREAQKHALRLENTGLAVCIDVGDGDDLHPKNKPAVGRRLSLVARALTYGEQIPYSGPVYEGYRIEGNTIRIDFSHTDKGLKTSDGGPVRGFYIAGPDHKFHAAKAVIEGNTVVVSSDGVRFPVGVRYAWANNPVCNLSNGAGLPAGPFRTDDWTDGAKRY